jgi:hypothetical protein
MTPANAESFGNLTLDFSRKVLLCSPYVVGVGNPKKDGTGGTIAAPVFARIAERVASIPR